jgi:cell division ATPase MinD
MVAGMPKVIGIVSGKGGVGKTTVTMNLSSAFNQLNLNTVVIDADTKMAGMSIQLGMYNYPVTLNDLLKENSNVFDAIYSHQSGLKIIPSSFFNEYGSLSMLDNVINKLKPTYDTIFVDFPPGMEKDTVNILKSCEAVIAVVTPDVTSVLGAIKTLNTARDLGVEPLGVIVNRYNKNVKNQLTEEEITSSLEIPIFGVIPEDNTIRESVNRRLPSLISHSSSPSSLEFKKIATRISGIRPENKAPFIKKLFKL